MAEKLLTPASLGLSASLAKTWDSTLARELRVLVPIHVDALVVRKAGGSWAACSGTAQDGRWVGPTPFADLPQGRSPGVHLHWAVPDGLSKLSAELPNGPALPDRWLVVRVGVARRGTRPITAFVIESRSGRVTPLANWSPAPPVGDPVRVTGPGDPGWIGYFDNVENRFAFHDVPPPTEGRLAYLVCGWYAQPSDDPLADLPASHKALEARLKSLGWSVPLEDLPPATREGQLRVERSAKGGLASPHAERDELGRVQSAEKVAPLGAKGRPIGGRYQLTEPVPRLTLYHGAVVDLPWPGVEAASNEVGGPPASSAIHVAIGDSPAAALGALAAEVANAVDGGRWLAAFAAGALGELDDADGAVKIEDRLHDAAFVGVADGVETVNRTPDKVPNRPPPEPPKKRKPATGRVLGDERPFHEVAVRVPKPPAAPPPKQLRLPRPRLYRPMDPAIVLLGGRRSPKHGGDGRFTEDGRLACRLSATGIRSLTLRIGGAGSSSRLAVRPTDIFDHPLQHGGIPSECEELLAEAGLLDPGSAAVIGAALAGRGGTGSAAVLAARAQAEATAWWAVRDPAADASAILAQSGFEGRLPSEVAIQPGGHPWVPLHLDWEVELIETPARSWTPGEIDFEPPKVPTGPGRLFSGRTLVGPGPATLVTEAAKALDEAARHTPNGTGLLEEQFSADALVRQLEVLDFLSGSLEGLHRQLRAQLPPDGPPAGPAPPGFVAVRAGFLRIRRLRLVDAFGQYRWLAAHLPDGLAEPTEILVGSAIQAGNGILALPPRFTSSAQLSFRFRSAADPSLPATDAASPVCGWLLPDHLDTALEFAEASGSGVGQLRTAGAQISWEEAPGRPSAFGGGPQDALSDPTLRALASALLAASRGDQRSGVETALSAFLRVIDATRWTVDPFGHAGEEHLALLIGHPVAVVRASLRVDVREPVGGTDATVTRVPVRLGSLTHWRDGLYGVFVGDDFTKVRCASAAMAGCVPPLQSPFVDGSGILWVVPGVEVPLVLLLEPHTQVHATTCLLPRKSLALTREWTAPGLSALAPTFRFGPVLRDPTRLRMPIPADVGGVWTWTHRADVDRWEEEEVIHAGGEALLPPDPTVAVEGWLKLTPREDEP